MSLQWTAVATFLYAEVFAVLLLCIPFISPKRWQKIFKSRLVELVVTYGNTFFVVLIVILVLLVIDAVREIRKYDDVTEKVNLQNNPGAVEHFHMKLFRAQRNLYIAGFSLLLSFFKREQLNRAFLCMGSCSEKSGQKGHKTGQRPTVFVDGGAEQLAVSFRTQTGEFKEEQSCLPHCAVTSPSEKRVRKVSANSL
ncbi:hypothetical protein FD755_015971 [Muntiacus reevesi]|uniref:B-cell receptor-associated protein n=1 Tax=Muntiacus reevesi TaxID=9886 RepID=A0A5N3XDK1_MUNRE|nr:hypothetical protein FD755_015971 [Muntiacus reevesi]